jgi:Ca2+-binding EF-hand superfamily protein
LLPPGHDHRVIAERVAADWAALGVTVVISEADAATIATRIKRGTFDLALTEASVAVPDAAALLARWRCDAGLVCDPAADALLEKARAASPTDQSALIAEADLDGNGEIGYDEFIPLAVELVHNMYARMDAEAERETRERNAAEEAVSLIHGMNKEELEELLVETFRKADADGSGALSMEEFKNACFEMDIGLTRREVNILMHQCDIDGDGTISYEEFVPVCFEMLVEVVRRDILQSQRTDVEIERFLIKIWQAADVMNEGMLAPNKMSGALRMAHELPLTRLQIHSVLGEVSDDLKDSRGSVDYVRFAPIASKVIERMLLPEAQAERRVALQQLGGVPPVKGGRSEGEIHQTLLDEFRRADRMNTGVVTLDDFFGTLVNSTLQLNDYELNMLASVMEFTQDDRVYYPSACEAAYGVLLFCAEQEALGQGLR